MLNQFAYYQILSTGSGTPHMMYVQLVRTELSIGTVELQPEEHATILPKCINPFFQSEESY